MSQTTVGYALLAELKDRLATISEEKENVLAQIDECIRGKDGAAVKDATCTRNSAQQTKSSRASRSTEKANHSGSQRKNKSSEIIDLTRTLPCNIEKLKDIKDVPIDASNLCQKLREKYPEEFRRFDEDIKRNWDRNKQDEKILERKMLVKKELLDLLQKRFPGCHLIAFGSMVNGFGSKKSDMDLCLFIEDSNHGFNTERQYALQVLTEAQLFLQSKGQNLVKNITLIPAKTPILKLVVKETCRQLDVDINCNSVSGIYNSHLLQYYNQVDDRFAMIGMTVKQWAANAGIHGATTGTLSSYSLVLLVLHYLQSVADPPVLPNLLEMFSSLLPCQKTPYTLRPLNGFPVSISDPTKNKQTVGELLIGFFEYYRHFDFKTTAISIRRGKCFKRSDVPQDSIHFKVYIEEPFTRENTARSVVAEEKITRIKSALNFAVDQIEKHGPQLQHIGIFL